MSRTPWALMLLMILAACAGRYAPPPRNLDDACSIVTERPSYIKAFRATERKWGVPTHVQMAVIYQESRFDANARTPMTYVLGIIPMGRKSSAYGYSQALDGTWNEYRRATGRRRAKRDRIRDASDFIGWYMSKSNQRNGIALTNARNQYLAYHEGHTGYARGTYRNKSWLIRVADRVDDRAGKYQAQLAGCRKAR